jgi:hypothetical protein
MGEEENGATVAAQAEKYTCVQKCLLKGRRVKVGETVQSVVRPNKFFKSAEELVEDIKKAAAAKPGSTPTQMGSEEIVEAEEVVEVEAE